MEDNNQLENQDFQEYPLPRVKWRINFWLALIPYVIIFILLVFPQLVNLEEYELLRYFLAALLLFFPLIIQLIEWFIKWIKAVKNRIKNYDCLLKTLNRTINDFSQVKESLFVLFSKFSKFPEPFGVVEAHYNENSFFVVIRKNNNLNLFEGDRFIIIDKEVNSYIGVFKIINDDGEFYFALGEPGLDPMWAGFIRSKGKVGFLPFMQAFYITEGDNHGN